MSVAGGEPEWVKLLSGAAPAASPVADVLAYLVGGDGKTVPMILDLSSGETRGVPPLTEPASWNELAWSADGRRLLVVHNDTEIVEVELAAGRVARRFAVGADLGATYAGDEVVVGRTTWEGDVWTARLR